VLLLSSVGGPATQSCVTHQGWKPGPKLGGWFGERSEAEARAVPQFGDVQFIYPLARRRAVFAKQLVRLHRLHSTTRQRVYNAQIMLRTARSRVM